MRSHVIRYIEVPRVEYEKLSDSRVGEPSEVIRAATQLRRFGAAREHQRARFSTSPNGLACNADMGPAEVRQHCELDATGRALMKRKPGFASAMAQLRCGADRPGAPGGSAAVPAEGGGDVNLGRGKSQI